MSETEKDWIDNATYQELLRRWRNSPAGDSIFQGEAGKYYSKVMAEKRNAVGPGAAVAASKAIGW
ncbi:hypothetical protein LCGC14_1533690 [marine sediment metagenome]|uniref:Uncharacterized protein n=1 Tax=marine sediment metagenome TaxID=412755 RepID=A0A0F9IV83_9ZZZZ